MLDHAGSRGKGKRRSPGRDGGARKKQPPTWHKQAAHAAESLAALPKPVVTLRKSYGSLGVRVFRSVDKPNDLVLLAEYEDLRRARQLFQSPEFREATQRAGVTALPDVTLADEVHHLSA